MTRHYNYVVESQCCLYFIPVVGFHWFGLWKFGLLVPVLLALISYRSAMIDAV